MFALGWVIAVILPQQEQAADVKRKHEARARWPPELCL